MGRFDVLTQLDSKPLKTTSRPEERKPLQPVVHSPEKKTLTTNKVMNELHGQSAFIPKRQQEPSEQETPSPPPVPETPNSPIVVPRYHDTKHDTTIPRHHDTISSVTDEGMVEEVRKAVRQIGKEPATQRLTLDEKQALAEIEYSYKRQGIKTSGNEIIRIATNYIVRDFRKNGAKSILAQVVHKLNS
jgi:hypothetical protein